MTARFKMPFVLKRVSGDVDALSCVVSAEVFDRICDMAEGIMSLNLGHRTTNDDVAKLREGGIITLICRGELTQPVFDLLEIDSKYNYISVVRQGFYKTDMGQQVLDQVMGEGE